MNLIVSRKLVVTMGAVLMIGPGMIGLFTNPYVAIMLLCVGGFAHQALSGALITLSSDVFGRNEVATANGLTGMSAWLASTLFALGFAVALGLLQQKIHAEDYVESAAEAPQLLWPQILPSQRIAIEREARRLAGYRQGRETSDRVLRLLSDDPSGQQLAHWLEQESDPRLNQIVDRLLVILRGTNG